MPELPEVETIRQELAKEIVGKKLQGVKITGVRRRAKILIIDLANKESLVFHLKLTGQLFLNSQPTKYSRAVFNFDDGSNLVFNDVRKFGWWKRVKNTSSIEKEFGPEPLEKDFTLEKFKQILSKRKSAKIKPLLMDQKFIAGIGNIYSDEILFEAKVNPLTLVKNLIPQQIEKIFKAIKKILKVAIQYQGSSVEWYLDLYGREGGYLKYHKVYQRTGQSCFRCGTKIKRLKIGGRSAHFCPSCQKP